MCILPPPPATPLIFWNQRKDRGQADGENWRADHLVNPIQLLLKVVGSKNKQIFSISERALKVLQWHSNAC